MPPQTCSNVYQFLALEVKFHGLLSTTLRLLGSGQALPYSWLHSFNKCVLDACHLLSIEKWLEVMRILLTAKEISENNGVLHKDSETWG